jgi:alpha-glucosidase
VNGKALNYSAGTSTVGWRFEGNTLTTFITLPSFEGTEDVKVEVRRAGNLVERRAELDGFAGEMTRLREAYDALNQTWPIGWSPDDLVDAMQTGDRLSYEPELAGEQIQRLPSLLPRINARIDELERNLTEQERQDVAKRLNQEYQQNSSEKIAADYKQKIARARAAIADIQPPAQ